jgi:hypothetical protein
MNLTTRILTAIPVTEPGSFNEILRALGDDAPERGDKTAWSEFFRTIDAFEQSGLIEVERRDGRFESAQLTDLGAERAREALRER